MKEKIDKNSQLADVLDILHRAGLVYLTTINGETQSGCVRDDLKALVFSLKELSISCGNVFKFLK